MKTAVIVVHGVCPTPRYQIQDAFATEFAARLNDRVARGKQWHTSILWPPISTPNAGPDDVHATALRIWQAGDQPDDPQHDAFDIFEGYWSPIDKNQTTPQSVLAWISRALFAPLNASAKLYAGFWKTAFDLGFVGTMVLLAVVLLAAAAVVGVKGYNVFAHAAVALKCSGIVNPAEHQKCIAQVPSILDMVLHPTSALPGFALSALGYLVAIFIGAFAGTQLILSAYIAVSEWRRRSNVAKARKGASTSKSAEEIFGQYQWWRFGFWALLAIVAFLGLYYVPFWRPFSPDPEHTLAWATIEMVAFVALIRGGLSILDGFFVNFLGDVQIYSTHDENARFYQLRKEIVGTVEGIILQVLRSENAPATTVEVPTVKALKAPAVVEPLYDRVFVVGHSLGSTISMDAILSVHELYAEGGLAAADWKRLRGFVSFGAALEKTKFFFDVRQPSVSVSPDHWRNDVYGKLFTENAAVLSDDDNEDGIFWANYWYFNDIVANEIASYRSAIRVGKAAHAHRARAAQERVVCANARLKSTFLRPPWHMWIHSDYLGDDSFWRSGDDHDGVAYNGVCDLLLAQ
ncbi:MAG: hypothetical protein JO233_07130 [Candidatus Eremiobacteraeota bacterium]|nr:hypothetical protein [Candidatus Eremiobacteraeota bacterium]